MNDFKLSASLNRLKLAMPSVIVVLLICLIQISAQEEENIGGAGAAMKRVQMNKLNDELLNGKIAPALMKTLASRKFVPWEQSAVRIKLVRTRIALGAVIKNISDNELATLLTQSEKSSSTSKNPYVLLTKRGGSGSYEAQLADRIKNAKGGLAPQDILAMSLDVCNNDYWLATLTAHNLLKEVAYAERSDKNAVIGTNDNGAYVTVINSRDISKKLIDLRPDEDVVFYDRMGPWYHTFGLFFVGGITSGTEAQVLSEVENFTRLLKAGSPPDYFKERINTWAANIAPSLNAQVAKNSVATSEKKSADSSKSSPAKSSALSSPSGKKGYWEFIGERIVKGKPFLVGPQDTSKIEAAGGGNAINTVYTQKNHRSAASFSWTTDSDLSILKPDTKIKFKGILTHSGDSAGTAGISLQPYGMEPGTGHQNGIAIVTGPVNIVRNTASKEGVLNVPNGPLFPDKKMEIRFEVYPGGATSALYRTYEWIGADDPRYKNHGDVQPASNWTGTWSTNYNILTLSQNGTRVTGTYAHKNGRIEGTAQGNVLRGKWYQSNGSGSFEFQMSTDKRSFTGKWGRSNTSTSGSWNGTRK